MNSRKPIRFVPILTAYGMFAVAVWLVWTSRGYVSFGPSPGTVGALLQPGFWMLASFFTKLAGIVLVSGTLVALVSRDRFTPKLLVGSQLLAVLMNVLQFLFAIYGPDV